MTDEFDVDPFEDVTKAADLDLDGLKEFVSRGQAAQQAVDAIIDADPDEEPPEPEGRGLSPEMAASLDALRHPDARQSAYRGTIPADLAAVWCPPRARTLDEQTCRVLIGAWGVDAFRASALHNAALQDLARDALTAEAKSDMKKTIERKKAAKR